MNLVVNEWLPEYFRPEAGDNEKRLLESFLNKFIEKTRYPSRPQAKPLFTKDMEVCKFLSKQQGCISTTLLLHEIYFTG